MYLMYVDEAGDTGLIGSPTRYFVLTGMVVHELRWGDCLEQLVHFRRQMRAAFGLRLREEFHAARLLNKPKKLARIRRNDRLTMVRHFANLLAGMADLNIINVLVDKSGKPAGYDVFDMAWRALIQRFENTLRWRNFPGPVNPDERGMMFCDHTADKKVVGLMRRMRTYNPIPNQSWAGPGYRNLPLSFVAEDANFRNSAHSYFIQAVDLATFLLYQSVAASRFMRVNGGHHYFGRLDPILCRHASPTSRHGIVRL